MLTESQGVGKQEYIPLPNTHWRHTNGTVYRVLVVANLHSTRPQYPCVVVYESPDGKVWARQLTHWHRNMVEE